MQPAVPRCAGAGLTYEFRCDDARVYQDTRRPPGGAVRPDRRSPGGAGVLGDPFFLIAMELCYLLTKAAAPMPEKLAPNRPYAIPARLAFGPNKARSASTEQLAPQLPVKGCPTVPVSAGALTDP